MLMRGSVAGARGGRLEGLPLNLGLASRDVLSEDINPVALPKMPELRPGPEDQATDVGAAATQALSCLSDGDVLGGDVHIIRRVTGFGYGG